MEYSKTKSLAQPLIEKMRQGMPQVVKAQFVESPIMSRVYLYGKDSTTQPIGWMPIPSSPAEALMLIACVESGWYILGNPTPFIDFYNSMLSAMRNENLQISSEDMTNYMSNP